MTSCLRHHEQKVCLVDGSGCDYKVYCIMSMLLIELYLFRAKKLKKQDFPTPMTSSELIITCITAFRHRTMLGLGFFHSVNLIGVIYAEKYIFLKRYGESGGSILAISPHNAYDVIVTSLVRVRLWFRPPFFSVCVIEHIYQVSYVQNENAVSCRFLKLTDPTNCTWVRCQPLSHEGLGQGFLRIQYNCPTTKKKVITFENVSEGVVCKYLSINYPFS